MRAPDRIDPARLHQNVVAWTAMPAIATNAPEEIGIVPSKTPIRFVTKLSRGHLAD